MMNNEIEAMIFEKEKFNNDDIKSFMQWRTDGRIKTIAGIDDKFVAVYWQIVHKIKVSDACNSASISESTWRRAKAQVEISMKSLTNYFKTVQEKIDSATLAAKSADITVSEPTVSVLEQPAISETNALKQLTVLETQTNNLPTVFAFELATVRNELETKEQEKTNLEQQLAIANLKLAKVPYEIKMEKYARLEKVALKKGNVSIANFMHSQYEEALNQLNELSNKLGAVQI